MVSPAIPSTAPPALVVAITPLGLYPTDVSPRQPSAPKMRGTPSFARCSQVRQKLETPLRSRSKLSSAINASYDFRRPTRETVRA